MPETPPILNKTHDVAGPLNAEQIRRSVASYFDQLGYEAMAEFTLKTGRRVDLLAFGPKDEVVIIEIKSSLADFRADQKWQSYLEWADRFFFAVAEGFPTARLPDASKAGILITDGYDIAVQQEAPYHKLSGQRRQHLVKRLARTALRRLAYLSDLGVAVSASQERNND